jgi:uncharacterized membrane protein YfcA
MMAAFVHDMVLGLGYGGMGLIAGFLSGLLGIGGGVVLLPSLLFVLPLLGGVPLSPFFATEISMIQVAFSSLMGILMHRPSTHVPLRRILLWAGSALVGGAIGGILSYRFSGQSILGLFLAETLIALVLLMIRPAERQHQARSGKRGIAWLEYPAMAGIGFTSGMLGVGGGFLFYPVLTLFFGYPPLVAVGSSLAVMFPMATAASVMKFRASGVLPPHTWEIVLGALAGSRFGARFTKQLGSGKIRFLQGVLLAATIVRVSWTLFKG